MDYHFVFLHAQVMSRVHFSGKKIFFFFLEILVWRCCELYLDREKLETILRILLLERVFL